MLSWLCSCPRPKHDMHANLFTTAVHMVAGASMFVALPLSGEAGEEERKAQKEINLKDDLEPKMRAEIYKNYLMYRCVQRAKWNQQPTPHVRRTRLLCILKTLLAASPVPVPSQSPSPPPAPLAIYNLCINASVPPSLQHVW